MEVQLKIKEDALQKEIHTHFLLHLSFSYTEHWLLINELHNK